MDSAWWLGQGGHKLFEWKRSVNWLPVSSLTFLWAPAVATALDFCSHRLSAFDYIVLALGMHDLVQEGECRVRHNGSSWKACYLSRTEGGEPLPRVLQQPWPVNANALPPLERLMLQVEEGNFKAVDFDNFDEFF